MTNGVLLFAFNNSKINYSELATLCAKKASTWLNVPVSVVTDIESSEKISKNFFDKVIIVNSESYYYTKSFRDGSTIEKDLWKNNHRDSVYELSPYDNTLVIDVDFLVNSPLLRYCWDQPNDFLIYKESVDLANWRNLEDFKFISQYSIPFYWATVFFFRKTYKNKIFFNLVSHIKENWNYYNFLYQLSSSNFRNDFAFSIAIHIMNGMTDGNFAKSFAGKLHHTLDKDILIKRTDNSYQFLLEKGKTYVPAKVSDLDIHIMNKYSLLRSIVND